VLTSKIIKM